MKKILLPLLLFFSCMLSFAQQSERKTVYVRASPHLKKFLDINAKNKQGILLEPFTVKEYPKQITLSDSLKKELLKKEPIGVEFYSRLTNTIPVWSPGSDYIFNMPGTFAFDHSKAKGGIKYVSEDPIIFKDCFKKTEPIKINNLKEYFDLQKISPNSEHQSSPVKK